MTPSDIQAALLKRRAKWVEVGAVGLAVEEERVGLDGVAAGDTAFCAAGKA